MFQLYSKGCEYAIKALVLMKDLDRRYGARDVCRRARIPEFFSRKIFQTLVGGKFLEAVSGPGGGYRLKRSPRSISILDVICAIDGPAAFDRCLMGVSRCARKNPCLLHDSWLRAKTRLLCELRHRKLQDLIRTSEEKCRSNVQRKGNLR